MQTSYDPLNFADRLNMSLADATAYAKKTRDEDLRRMRKQGKKVTGFRLTGQLRPYASLGVPDGRVRTVFYIQHYPETAYDAGTRAGVGGAL